MVLLESIMAKQRPAGANNRDLPWWFDIYHTAWFLSFFAVWYIFGFAPLVIYTLVVAIYFGTFN